MTSILRGAKFYTSVPTLGDLSDASIGEVVFAGRSNAGKSSVLNVLTDQKQLAHVSKTPGKTQLLNYFLVKDGRYLVDLPGYGYAKVPAKIKQNWEKTLSEYLVVRAQIKGFIVVMDIRHPLTEQDLVFLEWIAPCDKPVCLLLNKSDKLKESSSRKILKHVRDWAVGQPLECDVNLFSAKKKIGVQKVQKTIESWLF